MFTLDVDEMGAKGKPDHFGHFPCIFQGRSQVARVMGILRKGQADQPTYDWEGAK